MAKEVAGLIKLRIKGGAAKIHHLPLDLLWVLRVLISWNFAKRIQCQNQDKAGKILPVITLPTTQIEVF